MAKGSQPTGAGKKEPEEAVAKTVTVSARLTLDQQERLKKRAEAVGLDTGPYLRRLILEALDGKPEGVRPPEAATAPAAAPTPPPSLPPPPAAPPSSDSPPSPAPPRELAALKAAVDRLAGEFGRADPKAAIELLRTELGQAGKGFKASVDQLRDEVGRRDPKTGIDLLRTEVARAGERVQELRSDVVSALRLVMLFVSRLPKADQEKLTGEQIDTLLDQAFPGVLSG